MEGDTLIPELSHWNLDGVTFSGGRQTEVRYRLKLATFDQYLAMSQKQCKMGTHSYYRRLIGTGIRPIEWRYFQWLWVTLAIPNHPILTLCVAFPFCVQDEDRRFKFGRYRLIVASVSEGMTNHPWRENGQISWTI